MVISRDYTPTVRNLEMEEERMMNRCLYCKNEVTRYLFCSYPCYLGYSDNDGDKIMKKIEHEPTALTAAQQIRIAALNAATRISSNIPHSYSADERMIAFHNALKYYEKYITTGETK